MDDDDLYYPNHLEVLVNYLDHHSEDKFVFAISQESILVKRGHGWIEKENMIKYAKQISVRDLRYMNHIPNLSVVHYRDLFESVGYYDEKLDVLIDWDMYRRLAQVASPKFINVITSKYHRKSETGNNAVNQLTGLFYNDPIKYYNMRLYITSKTMTGIEKLDSPCLIVEINDTNKLDAKFFVAKYDNLLSDESIELLLVINCDIDKELLESIIYAERTGALVIGLKNKGNKKDYINNILDISTSSKNIFIDSLNDLNIVGINNALNHKNSFVHFSKRFRKLFPSNFYGQNIEIKSSKVSIIIPTFNNWNYTKNCINSIYKVSNKVPFELIIVDNNSSDETRQELNKLKSKHKNLILVFNEENLGFAKANNIGARKANNELLLFLNNDTIVKDKWLDELVTTIDDDQEVGIVGAKLLYPETEKIQHAGVAIQNQPHPIFPYHIFHDKRSDFIHANYMRQYSAVTGACLMIRKNIFFEVSGFDERFENGYEDVDLCFNINELGYKVVYNPNAELVHFESKSEGRFNKVEENVNLLHEKWEHKLPEHHFHNNYQPEVSIIIPVFNQVDYTKKCIDSIIKNTNTPYEIIVINNASEDGTKSLLESREDIVIINNEQNLGYPKAINQGLEIAKGKDFVLLNNDTLVTKGWLERLLEVKRTMNKVGIIGVYSNSISGPQLDVSSNYKSISEMNRYAEKNYEKRHYAWIKFPRIAFVCALISGEVVKTIGGLDERYSPGNFEDDDYCLRAQLAGYQSFIAADVFIHHFGSVSFSAKGKEEYENRLEINRNKFISKWGGTPEDIWIFGKSVKSNELFFPISKISFDQSINSIYDDIEKQDLNSALGNLKKLLKDFDDFDRRGHEKVTKEDLLNLAGNISLAKNELNDAKTFFEMQLEENPNSTKACFGLGEVFYIGELFNESKTMLEWAIANDEHNENAKNRLKEVNGKLQLPHEHNSLLEENKVE